MGIRKLLNRGLFNIGFVKITPDEFIQYGKLPKVRWMKHTYNDRFFADPFILNADDTVIECLAEEFKYGGVGTINLLTIDARTMELKDNEVVLSSDTHLSYPAYYISGDEVYVYPENGKGGNLSLYRFDKSTRRLLKERMLIDEPLVDSTIITRGNVSYLICTKNSDSPFKHAYLYKSKGEELKFEQIGNAPVVSSICSSRPAGNFFEVNGAVYRPAQDCKGRYGRAIRIMKVDGFEPYIEHQVCILKPKWFKYSLRLHTINFHKSGYAVIDACGYVYPIMGRILCPIYDLLLHIKGINYYEE